MPQIETKHSLVLLQGDIKNGKTYFSEVNIIFQKKLICLKLHFLVHLASELVHWHKVQGI